MRRRRAKRIRGKLAYPCHQCGRLSVNLIDRRRKASLCRRCMRDVRIAVDAEAARRLPHVLAGLQWEGD